MSDDSSIEYDPNLINDTDSRSTMTLELGHDTRSDNNTISSGHTKRKNNDPYIDDEGSEDDDIGLDDSDDDELENQMNNDTENLDDDDDDDDDDNLIRDSIESSLIIDDSYGNSGNYFEEDDDDDDDDEDTFNYADDDFDSDDYLSDSDYFNQSSNTNRSHPLFRSNSENLSLSKISFTKSRINNSGSILTRITTKRKPPPPPIQPNEITTAPNSIKIKQSLLRNSKSFTSLLNSNQEVESNEDSLTFDKRQVDNIPAVSGGGKSNLTSLINKKEISLDYYEYVAFKKSVFDDIINCSVIIPNLNYTSENPLYLKINNSFTVVEVIGFILLNIEKIQQQSGGPPIADFRLHPNHWSLYLADDDGEIEDDMGSLGRTREVKSYGADEFVLVECNDEETKINEKISPSPLQAQELQIEINDSGRSMLTMENNQGNGNGNGHNREMSVITIPSNLTPVSGVTLNSTMKKPATLNSSRFPPNTIKENDDDDDDDDDDDEDADEEEEDEDDDDDMTPDNDALQMFVPNMQQKRANFMDIVNDETSDVKDDSLIIDKSKKLLKKYQTTPSQSYSHSLSKDSKLTKLKNSKTLQSILHSTNYAQHQQHQQQLQQHQHQHQQQSLNASSQANVLSDLSAYYRWTVWRRQQMSFKNKHPKSLAVDGNQIYILPFNESKGSWYESKTTSFNISQVLRIKINPKIESYFKIVVLKNDEELKRYYLEAKSVAECKEIVGVIEGLIRSYHSEKRR
ncbi:hypothetical protein CANARDRAFT_176717 [[Candida] arabinofermentans NRRL YB-2248]|uniref:SAPK-interacting protein 1 Pleckstrin-homology domain-containing protein n=1 Tax=[Candida] arabinofermentans NRRL YB-2248 TaxID=983967 RepID=A0A1E4SYD8_9ASCO|nr:hypothetical protein CANARDRAFT_176717 [[Candida] arabinofermentans NRRL YB-2248]